MPTETGVPDPWMVDDVTELTDTDLVSARNHSIAVADPDGIYRVVIHWLGDAWGLKRGEAIDRVVRVHLARLMDSGMVRDLRADYDIRYLIPPPGWVTEHRDDPAIRIEGDISSVDPATDVDDTYIHGTVPVEVRDMVREITEASHYERMTDLCHEAIETALRDE